MMILANKLSPFKFAEGEEIFLQVEAISFGWKFHIACDPENFHVVFNILKQAIVGYPILLKALQDPSTLNNLCGTIQEGKAFTLYFPQDKIFNVIIPFAKKLLETLSACVPSPQCKIRESSFKNSRFLYYRFGEYEAKKNVMQSVYHPWVGMIHTCQDGHKWSEDHFGRKWLVGPEGELWMDRQEKRYKPSWIEDPFLLDHINLHAPSGQLA